MSAQLQPRGGQRPVLRAVHRDEEQSDDGQRRLILPPTVDKLVEARTMIVRARAFARGQEDPGGGRQDVLFGEAVAQCGGAQRQTEVKKRTHALKYTVTPCGTAVEQD